MQHNPMLLKNVQIEQAQLQAEARIERRARRARGYGERRGLVTWLRGR